MSDRLAELRRQRALMAEHLAWLDREIAGTGEKAPSVAALSASVPAAHHPVAAPTATPTAPADPTPAAATAPATAVAPEVAAAADAILEEYRVQPDSVHTDVKKGCFLYFAAAFALLAAVVTILYYALKKN